MILPIIIMPERHWDADAKNALLKVLAPLKSQGYEVIGFESPSDESENELIFGIRSTIQFFQERYTEAQALLNRRGIHYNLSDMNYSDLQKLLLNYVSSRYSNEMAIWFKELPGNVQKLRLAEVAQSLGMAVRGFDLIKSEMEPLRCREAQENLQIKFAAIDLLDDKRIESFKKHLVDIQQTGKGVIFVVGKFHYEKLVRAFSEDNSLEDVIFIHPHSSKCFDSSVDDRPLDIIEDNERLTLIDQKIENSDDFEVFAAALNQAIQSKIDLYKDIEPTGISNILSEKTGLSFNLCMRPSMHVDAYHTISEGEEIGLIAERLYGRGICGSFTFFRGARSYCIPSLNSSETSSAITKLDFISK